jgi:plastocyanin
MKTFSLRIGAVEATIGFLLVLCAATASGATVTVTVGNGGFFFSPSSVTIHPGDTVRWTFSSTGHSTTSGTPGMPNGLWNSGILNQGAVFTHTFNTVGTFPYYCTPHGSCCGMTGTVRVVTSTGAPTVTTNPATLIASFSARLNGSLNPNGLTTTVRFQYGLTTSYGSNTANQTQTGNTSRPISANISGLLANRTYHFRIVATNSAGTRFGADRTFRTP